MQVAIHQLKAELSKFISYAQEGEEVKVYINEAGTPPMLAMEIHFI